MKKGLLNMEAAKAHEGPCERPTRNRNRAAFFPLSETVLLNSSRVCTKRLVLQHKLAALYPCLTAGRYLLRLPCGALTGALVCLCQEAISTAVIFSEKLLGDLSLTHSALWYTIHYCKTCSVSMVIITNKSGDPTTLIKATV